MTKKKKKMKEDSAEKESNGEGEKEIRTHGESAEGKEKRLIQRAWDQGCPCVPIATTLLEEHWETLQKETQEGYGTAGHKEKWQAATSGWDKNPCGGQ